MFFTPLDRLWQNIIKLRSFCQLPPAIFEDNRKQHSLLFSYGDGRLSVVADPVWLMPESF